MKIDREDLLELTRRMTLKRNCFARVAGAYMDGEGYIDGTFNTNFLALQTAEKGNLLNIAKKVLFAETNVSVKGYGFAKDKKGQGSVWQLLQGMKSCELKNDALLEIFYDMVTQEYRPQREYGILVFYGCYDVPMKGTDRKWQNESEEVYQFLVGAICPLVGEYEPGEPEAGFLFPAFTDRSSDNNHVAVFQAGEGRIGAHLRNVLGCQ